MQANGGNFDKTLCLFDTEISGIDTCVFEKSGQTCPTGCCLITIAYWMERIHEEKETFTSSFACFFLSQAVH